MPVSTRRGLFRQPNAAGRGERRNRIGVPFVPPGFGVDNILLDDTNTDNLLLDDANNDVALLQDA